MWIYAVQIYEVQKRLVCYSGDVRKTLRRLPGLRAALRVPILVAKRSSKQLGLCVCAASACHRRRRFVEWQNICYDTFLMRKGVEGRASELPLCPPSQKLSGQPAPHHTTMLLLMRDTNHIPELFYLLKPGKGTLQVLQRRESKCTRLEGSKDPIKQIL